MRLEKWFISNLDDSQRKIIVQSINDDIIVQGAAGSGKTNLAIHRALQAKGKGSYAIVIFTIALKRMIAYGMQALGLDKERIAYEWAWINRGFDLTGDVYWEKGNRNILYLVNDLDIRKFGSQGQQRTAALSLKLAEIELVKRIIGDTPILLLDDVLSELDKNRQNYLLDSIHDIQTVITLSLIHI